MEKVRIEYICKKLEEKKRKGICKKLEDYIDRELKVLREKMEM